MASEARRGRRKLADAIVDAEDWPSRAPTNKEAADSGVKLEDAAAMPWLPTHKTVCGDRPCSLAGGVSRGTGCGDYIHREAWVESRQEKCHIHQTPHDYHEDVQAACSTATSW